MVEFIPPSHRFRNTASRSEGLESSISSSCDDKPQAFVAITGIPIARARIARRGWCSTHAGRTSASDSSRSPGDACSKKSSSEPSLARPSTTNFKSTPSNAFLSSKTPFRPNGEQGKNNCPLTPLPLRFETSGNCQSSSHARSPKPAAIARCGVITFPAISRASLSARTSSGFGRKSPNAGLSGCCPAASSRIFKSSAKGQRCAASRHPKSAPPKSPSSTNAATNSEPPQDDDTPAKSSPHNTSPIVHPL